MNRKIPKQVIEAIGASPDSDAVSAVLRFLAERGQLMTPDQCAAFLQIEVGTLYVMKHQRRPRTCPDPNISRSARPRSISQWLRCIRRSVQRAEPK